MHIRNNTFKLKETKDLKYEDRKNVKIKSIPSQDLNSLLISYIRRKEDLFIDGKK
jgi:hypothetical protein